jgi:hypothetical protein
MSEDRRLARKRLRHLRYRMGLCRDCPSKRGDGIFCDGCLVKRRLMFRLRHRQETGYQPWQPDSQKGGRMPLDYGKPGFVP